MGFNYLEMSANKTAVICVAVVFYFNSVGYHWRARM